MSSSTVSLSLCASSVWKSALRVSTPASASLRMASSPRSSLSSESTSSVAGNMVMLSSLSIERWDIRSKKRMDSTSSPHSSMRTGLSMVRSYISTISPLRAKSPGAST